MMRYLILLLSISLFNRCENLQQSQKDLEEKSSYRIVSYNVENLFDTWDEEFKFDDDFTPTGTNFWGKERYEKKLNDIGKVLVNTAAYNVPAIIGLVEVENKRVLEDLLNKTPLTKFQYAIVHEESPDERGIDVALLYDTEQFQFLDYEIGRVEFPEVIADKTRDMLIVEGYLAKEKVYVVVNHWPSRRGGASVSEPKRIHVAKMLHKKVNEILEQEPEAGIILMGDFNDTPMNKSIAQYLGAGSWENNKMLVNLMTDLEREGKGSYKYQNQWNMLDQFIVSKNLTDEQGKLRVRKNSAKIFAPDWLREDDPYYPGDRIFRTYRGPRYVGGYSDLFPIVLDITMN